MKIRLKKKKRLLKSILILFVASTLMACDKQTVYHAFRSIPTEGWRQKDTLLFEVNVPDSQTYYKIAVEIRNQNKYPYRNINLALGYEGPDAKQLPTDTVQCTLADEQGKWQGNGWSGLYESTFPIGSMRIGKPGKYTVKVVHLLPDTVLPGINDVGIRIRTITTTPND